MSVAERVPDTPAEPTGKPPWIGIVVAVGVIAALGLFFVQWKKEREAISTHAGQQAVAERGENADSIDEFTLPKSKQKYLRDIELLNIVLTQDLLPVIREAKRGSTTKLLGFLSPERASPTPTASTRSARPVAFR